jgi:hypothetical protein
VINRPDLLKKVDKLGVKERHDPDKLAETNCMMLDRCRLVYKSGNASLLDVKLVARQGIHNDLPKTIGGIDLYGDFMSKQKLLEHKAIIMLEGNGEKKKET